MVRKPDRPARIEHEQALTDRLFEIADAKGLILDSGNTAARCLRA
jgi:hypothetical protein